MQQQQSKKGFENANEKLLRLLKRFNEERAAEFESEDEVITVMLRPSGAGKLVLQISDYFTTVYAFDTLDELVTYLGAGPLKREMMQQGL